MEFQPFTFEDFGADAEAPLGFSVEAGNKELAKRKKEFLGKFQEHRPKIEKAWGNGLVDDFVRAIAEEKSWQILQYLGDNREDLTDDFDRFQYLAHLGDSFLPTLNLAVNSALYTQLTKAPGHTSLLKHSQDERSVLFNITPPDFQKRLVNGTFWELAAQTRCGREPLETILTDSVGSLDPAYSSEGFRILKRGLEAYHEPRLAGAGDRKSVV